MSPATPRLRSTSWQNWWVVAIVAVVVICEALMSVQAWRGVGASVDWHRVRYLLVGAAVGMPLGLWALTAIPEDAARAVISAYVLVMCLVLLAGWVAVWAILSRFHPTQQFWHDALAGTRLVHFVQAKK